MDSSTKAMVLSWLNGRRDDEAVEATARFMRDTLRIGSLTDCRRLVLEALAPATPAGAGPQ